MPPKRLPFLVRTADSEAPGHSAMLLQKLDPTTTGWETEPFCTFPVTLELELSCRSQLCELQLLCHEFKIPSLVEVFLRDARPHGEAHPPAENDARAAYQERLGVFTLGTNARSDYFARELKNVTIEGAATHIKLVLHDCHPNKHNTQSQVALMSLSVFGEPCAVSSRLSAGMSKVTMQQRTAVIQPHNVEVAKALLQAETAKQAAIAHDDLTAAKECHLRVQQLSQINARLNALERDKQAAVHAEHYDAAQRCKMEMEHIKSLVLPQVPAPRPPPLIPSLSATQPLSARLEATSPISGYAPRSPERSPSDDNRPLNVGRGGASLFTEEPPGDPEGEPLTELETLNQASVPGAHSLVKVFGEETARKLLSKDRQWRESGIRDVLGLFESLEPNALHVLEGLALTIEHCLNERVASVFFGATPLLGLVCDYVVQMGIHEVSSALSRVIQVLLQRSVDSNHRVSKEATAALTRFLKNPKTADLVLNSLAPLGTVCEIPKQLHTRVLFLGSMLPEVPTEHKQKFVAVSLPAVELGLSSKDLGCRDDALGLGVACLQLVEATSEAIEERLPNIQPAHKKKMEQMLADSQGTISRTIEQ
eukprot:TRINITY_DN16574_c0_g1_i1.p1 TRINITY_DN16574_c0_g1~~TRINITY_DN16574_c0_g1_i1.p1  ORF type:complete len:594 (-),score=123.22 TRINITY_DN16574_c0_g1_i1:20-1801(-)